MESYGIVWKRMVACEIVWKHVKSYSNVWKHVKSYSNVWKHVKSYGNVWKRTESYDCRVRLSYLCRVIGKRTENHFPCRGKIFF